MKINKKRLQIYRITAIKDKITKYKISDPFLIFFLNKYENLIPWVQITSEQDINAYISSSLIPPLQDKINPESNSNHYLKDIDLKTDYQNNPNDPQLQAAWVIYQQNPEEAKKIILETVNQQKKTIFDSWWNYLTKVNDIYINTPSFSFIILKPIFDSSTANDKHSIMPLNEMAVASLYEKIQNSGGNNNFKVEKQYSKEVNIANQKKIEAVPGTDFKDGNGWIKLPSQINDPENFSNNVNKLIGYSIPNSWCTGSGMAVPYLRKGDFYLYIVNGKAEVAIRMEGQHLGEIQGERNEAPFYYVDKIEEFLKAKNIDPSNDYHYKRLMEAKQLNETLNDPKQYDKFLLDVKENPYILDYLSTKNRTDPLILHDVAKVIDIQIKIEQENISDRQRNYLYEPLSLAYYNKIPNDIRKKIIENKDFTIFEFVIKSILKFMDEIDSSQLFKVLQNNFLLQKNEILQEPRISKTIKEKTEGFLKENPWKMQTLKDEILEIFSPELFEEGKKHPISQTIENLKTSKGNINPESIVAEYWQKPDEQNYNPWQNVPYYKKKELSQNKEAYQTDLAEWEKKNKLIEDLGETDIRGIDEVRDALLNAWTKYVEQDVHRYEEALDTQRDYTDYYADENPDECPGYTDIIRDLATEIWTEKINEDPREISYAPEDISYLFTDDYQYEEEDNRDHHITGIWLNYFLNGHLDEIGTLDGSNAIEDFSEKQMDELVSGIISSKTDITSKAGILYMKTLPLEIQKRLTNYSISEKEKWENLKEQGQQELDLNEENEEAKIANVLNWYKLAKSVQYFRYQKSI